MAGRPTIYTPELIEAAHEYEKNWSTLYPDDVIPSLEGLALHIGISRDTIYDWKGQEGKEDFSDIVNKVMHNQAKTLINKGLKGTFNAPITKVILTKHGYRDAVDTDITSKGEQVNTVGVESRAASILDEQSTTEGGNN